MLGKPERLAYRWRMTPAHGSIAIQHLQLSYWKKDRGAEAGAMRNALPRIHPFSPPERTGPGWYHSIMRQSHESYRVHESYWDLATVDRRRLPIALRADGDFLEIRVVQHGGKIKRPQLDKPIARLPFGQRVAIHFNNAHDGDHQRSYSEQAIHVGWAGEASLDLPLFREIDLRELLY